MGLIKGAQGKISSEIQEVKFHPGTGKLLARMADTFGGEQLENIEINQDKLLAADTGAWVEISSAKLCNLPKNAVGGIVKAFIVTTKSTEPEFDFFSRVFVPWAGIPEDAGKICLIGRSIKRHLGNITIAVTGSAHAVLAPFWSAILNKTMMKARQCSARGGDLGSFYSFV